MNMSNTERSVYNSTVSIVTNQHRVICVGNAYRFCSISVRFTCAFVEYNQRKKIMCRDGAYGALTRKKSVCQRRLPLYVDTSYQGIAYDYDTIS